MSGWESTRRRVCLGAASLVGLAGCGGTDSDNSGANETETPTPTSTETETSTPSTTEEDSDGPGYKKNHWHGRLFFEIDGEFVDFDQSKYYLDNIDDEDAVYFHFHDSAHGPNEWSNEKQIVTFQRALNLLPGIEYERQNGEHVLTYEDTTFDASDASTDISTHRGTEQIDPTTYEVQHDDNFWVDVRTEPRSGSGGDERSGKFFVDLNNRRLDLKTESTQDSDSGRFEFRDDGQPYTWYNSGGPVTLEYALGAIAGLTYERGGEDNHVITYKSDDEFGGTYRAANENTEILVRQRGNSVDPTSYELQDGDAIWVYVHTSNAPDNEH